MISPSDLTHYVIDPVLSGMAKTYRKPLDTPAAVQLVLCTVLHESSVGSVTYLDQVEHLGVEGPAYGVGQVEKATHTDLLRWLAAKRASDLHREGLREFVLSLKGDWPTGPRALHGNLNYSVAMVRLKFWTIPEPLPAEDDPVSQARYWSVWYNTHKNPDWERAWVRTWRKHVEPLQLTVSPQRA
jgi:hypothetical protein